MRYLPDKQRVSLRGNSYQYVLNGRYLQRFTKTGKFTGNFTKGSLVRNQVEGALGIRHSSEKQEVTGVVEEQAAQGINLMDAAKKELIPESRAASFINTGKGSKNTQKTSMFQKVAIAVLAIVALVFGAKSAKVI